MLKFGYRLQDDDFKQVFAIVATVVIAVVAPYLAPAVATAFGVTTATALALTTAGLTMGATLLSNALFPAVSGTSAQIGTGTIDGKSESRSYLNLESGNNVLAKESHLPVIAGLRRVSLPEIAQPRGFLDPESGLQTLQRIFALDGEHAISDIQVDGVPIEGDENFQVEIIEGADTDPTDTFITKVSWSENISSALSNFSLNDTILVDQDNPANSSPRWERFKTRYDGLLESINIRLSVSGMINTTSADIDVRVPLRIRFRALGSPDVWINLPEIHFIGRLSDTVLQEITLRWDDGFGGDDQAGDISHDFFQRVATSHIRPTC